MWEMLMITIYNLWIGGGGAPTFSMDSNQVMLTWNNSKQYWENGMWDYKVFNQALKMSRKRGFFNLNIKDTKSSFYTIYTLSNIKMASHISS